MVNTKEALAAASFTPKFFCGREETAMTPRKKKAKHLLIVSSMGLLAAVALCGSIRQSWAKELPPPPQQQAVQQPEAAPAPDGPTAALPPLDSPSPPDCQAPPADPQEPAAQGAEYDYAAPVPLSQPVERSYFDDAVFIGDSLTEELILTTSLSNTTVYAYKGLMVDTAFTKAVIRQGEQKVSVMDALAATDFAKVYIMFGINETGWVYSNIFQEKYGAIIDRIREINPDALIYIQSILPVSQSVTSTHSYITNDRIDEYNSLLRQLAEEKQVYYVDVRQAVMGEDGALPEDAAPDGIHPVRAYCEQWLSYLQEHTV